MNLQDLDRELMKLLEQNARLTCKQLATMLETTEEVIKERMAWLEKNGYIMGYSAIINWEKTGRELITALIEVKVSPEREVGFDRIAERVSRFPEVKCVYLMSGTYDLMVLVEGSSMIQVANFVSQRLATLENVQSTTTHFLLKRYKRDGFIYNNKEEDHRLVIQL